jgi:hypothetical protein
MSDDQVGKVEIARKRGEAAFNSGGSLGDNPFGIAAYGEWKAWRGGFKARRNHQRLIDAAKPIGG